MRSRRPAKACLLLACLLLLLAVTLWFDNPAVDVSASDFTGESGGEVGCSIAPWDAGLNGNDEGPGGEHPHDYFVEVGAACYAANMTRFRVAVGAGALALAALAAGVFLALRPRSAAGPRADPA
ncbi:hypothetical protein [Nocardioides sp. WS12]|uniref:hypothetical protein n=1 Tax=Nocardioides sp. WS12 TaxID=2486272 RepID=UPI0015FABCD4|nr:hypothetical protein [Nocardioides sp. WS12]